MYWDQFTDRGGFDDGDSLPSDAHQIREVYLRLINARAAHLGSKHREIAFNRAGAHNPCMVECVTKEFYDTLSDQQKFQQGADHGPDEGVARFDDAMDTAIDWAADQNPESMVDSVVTISEAAMALALANAVK